MITSTSNPHVKWIRKLRDRDARKESGCFYAEGIRLVGEAFQLGTKIKELIYCKQILRSEFGLELVEKAKNDGLQLLEVSENVFKYLSNKEGPQGLAIIAAQKTFDLEILENEGGIWVGLEAIQDAGNLGTILRTADSAGAKGIIQIDHGIDPFDPAVIRASMGAIFSQRIIQTNLQDFLDLARRIDFSLIGTSDKAKVYYREVNYPKNTIILFGSEQKGLSENLQQICHNMVYIPMVGRSDSLNISIAAGIVLYEAVDQHYRITDQGK